jgi:hypothetical protein
MAILSDGRPSLGRGVPPGQLHESEAVGKEVVGREGAREPPLQGNNSESGRNAPFAAQLCLENMCEFIDLLRYVA